MHGEDERKAARFTTVTAAHHFVLRVLPFRNPESRSALKAFLDLADNSGLSAADLEPILLRVLSILDRHGTRRPSTLIDRYLTALEGDVSRCASLNIFREAVEGVMSFQAIGNSFVRRAIATIEAHSADPRLTTRRIAGSIGRRPELLADEFFAETGLHIREFLENVRIDRAASLLVSTDKTVKEIWVAVGYNHASNFNHSFKKRFAMAPLEYRARGTWPAIAAVNANTNTVTRNGSALFRSNRSILVVDDDQGTRETLDRYLRIEGYAVTTAASARDALHKVSDIGSGTVLLDYRLPDMDGLECLRLLRRQNSRASVVVFSADWNLEDRRDELTALGAVFLFKLCSLEDIRNTLHVIAE